MTDEIKPTNRTIRVEADALNDISFWGYSVIKIHSNCGKGVATRYRLNSLSSIAVGLISLSIRLAQVFSSISSLLTISWYI